MRWRSSRTKHLQRFDGQGADVALGAFRELALKVRALAFPILSARGANQHAASMMDESIYCDSGSGRAVLLWLTHCVYVSNWFLHSACTVRIIASIVRGSACRLPMAGMTPCFYCISAIGAKPLPGPSSGPASRRTMSTPCGSLRRPSSSLARGTQIQRGSEND